MLGGGLTGLATAFYLTRFMPDANVTIYEGSDRLGGWIDTQRMEVESQTGKPGFTLFERGARTVQAPVLKNCARVDPMVFLDLVSFDSRSTAVAC